MKNRFLLALFFIVLINAGCTKSVTPGHQPPTQTTPYFPPLTGTNWDATPPAALGWNESALAELNAFLEQKGTKAFIILKNGKLVTETYFGAFTADSLWYWASAGKTATAFLAGIAQQEGKLDINKKTADYLGLGWTALPKAKEELITVRHQLTMTTGLDDAVPDTDCTLPGCLQYKADAGARWAYHNAPYTLMDKVIETATGATFNAYFQQKIGAKTGITGRWLRNGYNNVLYTTPRSMARFGLLLLNKGTWNGTPVLADSAYFNAQVRSSQAFNPSYGYLTWLNGKGAFMLPGRQTLFSGNLIPDAPPDLFAALGKNDQKLYVVPSQQLVVVRMGESAGGVVAAASGFDNELWQRLKTIIKY